MRFTLSLSLSLPRARALDPFVLHCRQVHTARSSAALGRNSLRKRRERTPSTGKLYSFCGSEGFWSRASLRVCVPPEGIADHRRRIEM